MEDQGPPWDMLFGMCVRMLVCMQQTVTFFELHIFQGNSLSQILVELQIGPKFKLD